MAIAGASLFVALDGTSLAATGLLGTNQTKSGAITTSKVHSGAITASKVAPNTFLPADGTAQNASALGNHPASAFLRGQGSMFANRIKVPAGQSRLLLGLGFGDLIGKCATGGVPQIEYQSTSRASTFDDGTPHVATAWTSGQDIGGNSCIFIGQALATS